MHGIDELLKNKRKNVGTVGTQTNWKISQKIKPQIFPPSGAFWLVFLPFLQPCGAAGRNISF